jgi:hypothetical protein
MIQNLTAIASAVLIVLPVTPAHADSPAVYRGVVLSTANPAMTPRECSTSTRVTVQYTDPDRKGPPPGSGIQVTYGRTGAAVPTTAGAVEQRDGVTSVPYTVRLCGFASPETPAETGWYRVAVRDSSPGPAVLKTGFTARYQARIFFNAGPEPVKRGGFVTLTASVTDGWEDFDTSPVRFSFRRTGGTAWRDFGAATPRCDRPCGEGAVSYTASTRHLASGVAAHSPPGVRHRLRRRHRRLRAARLPYIA